MPFSEASERQNEEVTFKIDTVMEDALDFPGHVNTEFDRPVINKQVEDDPKEWMFLYRHDVTTTEAFDIIDRLLPEWWTLFKGKNNEYGTHDDDLGMRGQYADMHRKMKKLRNNLWNGKALTHEQPREVILDLIGHLFLTLTKGDKEGWKIDGD